MKRVLARKIFPYDPTFGGECDKYEGYTRICLQNDCPGISESVPVKTSGLIEMPILCSDLKRGRMTAEIVGRKLGLAILSVTNLNEVNFDLRDLVTKKEFQEGGSNLVRESFVQAFVGDALMEKRVGIKKRVDDLLNLIKVLPGSETLIISHSFFMKILQVYTKDKDLFTKPEMLRDYFDTRVKTFDNGAGFDFDL